MKKLLTTILVFVMCLSMCMFASAQVTAPDDAKSVFTLTSVSSHRGEVVEIEVSLKCSENVNSIALSSFTYDDEALEFVGFSDYDSALQSQMYFPVKPDVEKMALTIPLKEASMFNGKICTMSFKVKSSAKFGTYTVSATPLTKNKSDVINSFVIPSEIVVSDKPKKNFSGITFSDVTCTYDGKEHALAISGKLPSGTTVEYENERATDAGTYNGTATVSADGYNDLVLNATLKINPKDLTVTGLNAQNKTYDATTDATVRGGILNGVVTGDDVFATFPSKGIFVKADAGNNITVTTDIVTIGGNDKNNYNLKQPALLKANIIPAVLKVKANDITVTKGDKIPKLEYTITEGKLYENDNLSGVLAVKADGTKVGKFDITQGSLKATSNYKLEFSKGILTVTDKKAQNINVSEITDKTYGGECFQITVEPDENAKLSDFTFASSDKTVATIDADGVINIVGSGETEITVKQAGNEEYAPFAKTQRLVVAPKAVSITELDLETETVTFNTVVEKATFDFSALVIGRPEKVDDKTSKVIVSNFVLIGENAKNYTVSDKLFEVTVSNERLVSISVIAENGTITGNGTYVKGSEVILTAEPEVGYRFDGWYIGGKRISAEKTYSFAAGNEVPTAAFTKKTNGGAVSGGVFATGNSENADNTYIIRFVTNWGSFIKDSKVAPGGFLSIPDEPGRIGYVFGGWYKDQELTFPYDFNTPVTSSFTLYAKWIEEGKTLYTDVKKNDWFFETVEYVSKNGFMNGISETEFAPNKTLTRAMFVTVLYRMENSPETSNTVFTDVEKGSWYEKAVAWALENGIVNGISETEFAPDDAVTREQMAAIIYRYAKFKNYDVSVNAEISYTDKTGISDYAASAVAWAYERNIMSGNDDGSFAPADNATRAQSAAVFMRIAENLK